MPGIASSLSSVPPVWPSPRPESLTTCMPSAAASGATTSVVPSPTPAGRVLVDGRPGQPREVELVAGGHHRRGQRDRLRAREAVEVAGHQEGRHLVVGDVVAGVAEHELAQRLGRELLAVALGGDHVDGAHACVPCHSMERAGAGRALDRRRPRSRGAGGAARAARPRGARDELRERFAHGLSFGTAGLRGRLGAGPSRMNVATVRSASAGLAGYLLDAVEGARDGRRRGRPRRAPRLGALRGGGRRRLLRRRPAHLPAAAARADAAARLRGPPARLRGGRDGDREPQPAAGQRLQGLPRRRRPDLPARRRAHRGRDRARRRAEPRCRSATAASRPTSPRTTWPPSSPRCPPPTPATCGSPTRRCTASARGCASRRSPAPASRPRMSSRPRPSPTPTSRPSTRPNPEEPGTLDLALAEAAAHDADVLLANDPDADRLAVAIPGPDGWRRLHGDEIGALLADFLLEHCEDPRRALLVTTVASSTLLGRMAEAAGARYAETLTGFKWMMRAVADAPEHRLAARLRGGARLRGLRRRARQGRHLRRAGHGAARRDREARRAHAPGPARGDRGALRRARHRPAHARARGRGRPGADAGDHRPPAQRAARVAARAAARVGRGPRRRRRPRCRAPTC